MKDLIKVTSDEERAKSLLDTVTMRLDSIELLKKSDLEKYSSKIIEDYYESILELITALMCLDGYKTRGDFIGSHIATIEFLRSSYKQFKEDQINLIDDLRKKRIGIKYYGKHVKKDYLQMNEKEVNKIIEKLRKLAEKKI